VGGGCGIADAASLSDGACLSSAIVKAVLVSLGDMVSRVRTTRAASSFSRGAVALGPEVYAFVNRYTRADSTGSLDVIGRRGVEDVVATRTLSGQVRKFVGCHAAAPVRVERDRVVR